MTATTKSKAELKELLATLEAAENLRRNFKLKFYTPYPKQREFHAMGAVKRERLLMAGNQTGKSHSGAFETACLRQLRQKTLAHFA